MTHKKLFIGMLLLAAGQLLAAADPDPTLVPTPRTKVLAATATSRAFLGASRAQLPVDLATRGYAESEFAVRGNTGTGLSWVTRILVRRPQDARKFSGRVIVELLNAPARYETAPLWGFSWEYFLRRGDAWVGVTTSPAGVDTLRTFSAERYGSLNLAADEAAVCGTPQQGTAAGDVIAQVGALLRSSSKENPLLDLHPQRLIAAGYADSGDLVTRFASISHRGLRLGGDAPIFDGYLNVAGLAALSPACGAALPTDVPFVTVSTGMDMKFAPDRSSGDKQDTQSEGLRVFEVAGTDGARPPAAGMPAAADIAAAGAKASSDTACREPIADQILTHAINAIWQQIDDLLVLKQPMTILPSVEPGLAGSSGGWRLPQADLPWTGRVSGSPAGTQNNAAPRVCNAVTGSMPRFDAATLRQMYRDRNEYLRRFNAAADEAVKNRLLIKEDAVAAKASAARTTPAF